MAKVLGQKHTLSVIIKNNQFIVNEMTPLRLKCQALKILPKPRSGLGSFAIYLLALLWAGAWPLRADIIADYNFNGNLRDSISGSDGTFSQGTPTFTTITTGNASGEALVLNGTSDYVTIASSNLLNLNQESFTIAAWLIVNEVPNARREAIIIGRYPPANLGNIALTVDYQDRSHAGPTIFGYTGVNPKGATNVSKSETAYGTYENVVFTFDRPTQTLSLYINGTRVAQTMRGTGPVLSSSPYYIGYNPGSGTYLMADLDEIQIYNNSMTKSQIIDLYNDGNGPAPPSVHDKESIQTKADGM